MNNIFQTLLYQREKQKDTVLATIVWDDGSAPRGAGSQMLVGAEGRLVGTIGGGAETGEGVFSLPLPVGERAVIFGAGHIARALTPLLRTVGFRPVVVDDRPGFATAEHFPQADRTICGDFDRISDYLTLTPEDYVVIMTNGHEHDFQAEVQVLRGETAYVGVIGSRKKTAFVNQRLREAGIPEEKIAFVHTPVGTPIKAVTPEEIAVSIAGEMICVRAARREAAGEVHHGCPMH